MKHLQTLRLATFLAAAIFVSVPASAQTTAQNCLAAQQISSGADCQGIARCYSKAMATGTSVDPWCMSTRETRLVNSVAAVEAVANCLVKGIARSVGDQLSMGIDEIGTNLTLTGGRCASKKMAAIGKACTGYFHCNAKADNNSMPLDPACIQTHAAHLMATFAKLEATGKCATNGDALTLDGKVASLVDSVHAELRGTGTTTTTATATTN